MDFEPTRAAALRRLAEFTPRMGRDYVQGRNTDPGPGLRHDVSMLSPYLRHRLLTEGEVVAAAMAAHGPQHAEKFIQEVFWRSYWKGFLELRPAMWAEYRARAAQEHARLAANGGLRAAHERAVGGATGIACFDSWARELAETGWLHNHARMWFASIWIFTLRLPWVLGAEFFLHHLMDADAASNTLSWRWVAGIQTPGKNYLARAENIARHTQGRFDPRGELDEEAPPLEEPGPPPPSPLPPAGSPPRGRVALLLHEDDLSFWPTGFDVVAVAGMAFPGERSLAGAGPAALHFVEGAMADALARAAARIGHPPRRLLPEGLVDWARAAGATHIVAPWAPIGWTAEMLARVASLCEAQGVTLHRLRRPWDDACWPLARKGFFQFRAHIPALAAALAMPPAD